MHLLHTDGTPFGYNMKPVDWRSLSTDPLLPKCLRDNPDAVTATRTFCQEWMGLKQSEQKHLLGLQSCLSMPLSALLPKRAAAKKRAGTKASSDKQSAELREEAAN